MKFQNHSISSKVLHAYGPQRCCCKLIRSFTVNVLKFRTKLNNSKVNKVIYLSLPIYSLGFKALASIVFDIFCCQDFIHIFSKRHNSEQGHNPDEKKKYLSPIFCIRKTYMKFQNHSMNSSKVLLCIKQEAHGPQRCGCCKLIRSFTVNVLKFRTKLNNFSSCCSKF